jgi:hypothetical protein
VVAPSYAPAGKSLVSVTVLGTQQLTDQQPAVCHANEKLVRSGRQFLALFKKLSHPHAQPQYPGALEPSQRPVRVCSGIYSVAITATRRFINGDAQRASRGEASCRFVPLTYSTDNFASKVVAVALSGTFSTIFSHKPFRTIDDRTIHKETRFMARYSAFLGSFVDVQYRAGDICLPASWNLRRRFRPLHLPRTTLRATGQLKNFRWEIPYQCIVRLEESETFRTVASGRPAQPDESSAGPHRELQASAAQASAGASLLPISQRPKIA